MSEKKDLEIAIEALKHLARADLNIDGDEFLTADELAENFSEYELSETMHDMCFAARSALMKISKI